MGLYAITTEAEEALASGATETLLAVLGATTVKAKLVEWGLSFDGVTSTSAPIVVYLYQCTTSGTSTGATEVKWDRSGPTAQCAGYHSFTAEPTLGDRLCAIHVHPQAGQFVMQYPLGREPIISDASTSQGICITVTTDSGVTPNALAWMVWEE